MCVKENRSKEHVATVVVVQLAADLHAYLALAGKRLLQHVQPFILRYFMRESIKEERKTMKIKEEANLPTCR